MNSAVENSLPVADTAPGVRSQGLHDMAVWGTTIFLSAFLLFQVQPLLAKIILPWFGGGAGVWITTLVFFQITYLLGNLYAYWPSGGGMVLCLRLIRSRLCLDRVSKAT